MQTPVDDALRLEESLSISDSHVIMEPTPYPSESYSYLDEYRGQFSTNCTVVVVCFRLWSYLANGVAFTVTLTASASSCCHLHLTDHVQIQQ